MTAESELAHRAATFDELLGAFTTAPPTAESESRAVEARVAAWRRASAHGDRQMFERRLARDGWSIDSVTAAFATPATGANPPWANDARWIRESLRRRPFVQTAALAPFGDVFLQLIDDAEALVPFPMMVTATARDDRRQHLLDELTGLCAPPLFDRFQASALDYPEFILALDMDALFEEKPVLLRLIAVLTRQWIESSAMLCRRLHADEADVRVLAGTSPATAVTGIRAGLSDRHRGGQTVLTLIFDDDRKVLYKPKDLRVDAAWHSVVEWLNSQGPPVDLRAATALSRPGYGWSEFIEHTGCTSLPSVAAYFRRAGALLALLHCLAAADMHHENIIAHGGYPVPVDMEALLQGRVGLADDQSPHAAQHAAGDVIAESVLSVGLLPGYARSADGDAPVGGLAGGWSTTSRTRWRDVNSRAMRPVMEHHRAPTTNLPHIGGEYQTLDAHFDVFLRGFRDFSAFVRSRDWTKALPWFTDGVVRKVHRPTQFYHLLLDRLQNDHSMSDGVTWSVQADFIARLADWDDHTDTLWPIQRHERSALYALDIPHFETATAPGLRRAQQRIDGLDEHQVHWQVELIRQTSGSPGPRADVFYGSEAPALSRSDLLDEADRINNLVSEYAIRRDSGAAWLGLNWRPDSEIAQPAVLGPDLYSGNCGIALFLAAHSRTRNCAESGSLALAALTAIRADINGGNAARVARSLGIGGAAGLGSIVYALCVIATLLDEPTLFTEAQRAADLIGDDLISEDTRFDVVGGAAGAVLGLLRLHRDSTAPHALQRAISCGEHLLTGRPAEEGSIAGISHGAAGFAYALQALADATGSGRFADEAQRWLSVEQQHRRVARERQPQWCHGAAGTGLALMKIAGSAPQIVAQSDIDDALHVAEQEWPDRVDTLCCGTLGNVEMLSAAGRHDAALQRLSSVLHTKELRGEYRWSGGSSRFNAGLFRGLAGVGYTCLRLVDASLPSVLVWA